MVTWTEVLTKIKDAIVNKDSKTYAEIIEKALLSDLKEIKCKTFKLGFDGCSIYIEYNNNVIEFEEHAIRFHEIHNSSILNKKDVCYVTISLPVFKGTAYVYINDEWVDSKPSNFIIGSVLNILKMILSEYEKNC